MHKEDGSKIISFNKIYPVGVSHFERLYIVEDKVNIGMGGVKICEPYIIQKCKGWSLNGERKK